ncbi:MAG TPA: GNAT family N-acetyltransferase [Anaerolineales bacterium]|nr:GNAT family N-acetyltransferase [Anaerolineales bacterium]
MMSEWKLKILDNPNELQAVEALQRQVWPGNETEVVPVHMLVAVVHNGGLLVGAYRSADAGEDQEELIGFVFGFPGFYNTPDGPRLKHCSHMLAVHPDHRDHGLGFALKRAQWQMVRHQGLDRIIWTYDPLLSRNAHLNIAKLGAVCSTYHREVYGEMRDGLNVGLPSDRFEVDWWVNTKRVERRLSRRARRRLDLAHYFSAGAEIINPSQIGAKGWPQPSEQPVALPSWEQDQPDGESGKRKKASLLLLEIPADFLAIKTSDLGLALAWRLHTRALFEQLFSGGYLVTDFVFLSSNQPRSFYVLSHGESTL